MKKLSTLLLLFLCLMLEAAAQPQQPLRVIVTTDVHGNFFPRNFVSGTEGVGSLARIYNYVSAEREKYGAENVLLLDAGDILQGQPTTYYYNFVDTTSTHVSASVLNFMKYDALTIGNHDIETGHNVYDRWARQCNFPILGANVIDAHTATPYYKPYTIVEKAGRRIAIFGLLTPTVPRWLPEKLWSGMRFDDMLETARRYMPEMREKADIVIGLFHSGVGNPETTKTLEENASLAVARQVPGFDIVFCGHDHRRADTFAETSQGNKVKVLNAGPNAQYVSAATLTFSSAVRQPAVEGNLVDIRALSPDASFMRHFDREIRAVNNFTQEVIGCNEAELQTRPAYFGPSPFIDFIHSMQLNISGADISFAAPLSFDGKIEKGNIKVGNLFTLYPFENHLYVMSLTGQEIKDYLEYSYSCWTRQITPADTSLLNFVEPEPNGVGAGEGWKLLAVPSYNFDSAAGLLYTVDVTKPAGQKISITSLANGDDFCLDKTYRVAINSYRGNGGGGHLTQGAHIPKSELSKRLVWSTDKGLRYYLMQEIRREQGIRGKALNQWKFIPEEIVKRIRPHDEERLFR